MTPTALKGLHVHRRYAHRAPEIATICQSVRCPITPEIAWKAPYWEEFDRIIGLYRAANLHIVPEIQCDPNGINKPITPEKIDNIIKQIKEKPNE